ncbi:desiccation-related protein PCC13-62-like [Ananas comosus]|uniref:Desiccation-related protein PCC13-62-like n=1 Tax=Ananas comosus TaxID=4615 RepID=A0A6P5GNY8_ANACO|nr:desiccation-related protein PCC13-62-like [Ananas comosus]
MAPTTLSLLLLLLLLVSSSMAMQYDGDGARCAPTPPHIPVAVFPYDIDQLQFPLNLEFTESEFFLHGSLGIGLDQVAPQLALGGPPPIGAQKASLDDTTRRIIEEFGFQEVGHVRAIESTVGGFPRPLIDLSEKNFARLMDEAFGFHLNPPFNPYVNTLNYLLACYFLPYLGLTGYVGTNPSIDGYDSKKLLAGLLAVEAGQDAVIRTLLYERMDEIVPPYKNLTVADFTNRISALRNSLGMCGIKDEGLLVPRELGAEMRISTNIISADVNSLGYRRTPQEILRVLYGTGNEHVPGGFLPKGGNGKVARQYLQFPNSH